MKYEEMLKRARNNLPKSAFKTERFDIPKAKGHVQGNKTVITNFSQMCSAFGREPQHFLKYLQRELATPATIDDYRLILGRKISSSLINSKIEQYANDFVLCSECKKPDTKLIKEDGILFIRCMACGAKHPVKSKI